MVAKKQVNKSNNNSKFSKLARVFNFSTTKGKFLIFILIFAIVGGGYTVYKSYALSNEITFYPANISFYNEQFGTVADINSMKIVDDDTGQKAPVKVGQMPANTAYSFQIRTNSNLEKLAGFDAFNYVNRTIGTGSYGGRYTLCANVRGVGGSSRIRFELRDEGRPAGTQEKNVTNSYSTICFDFSNIAEGFSLRFGSIGSKSVNVDRISIYKMGG